jgi:tubulin polyglutamylase TTLL6/13
MYLISRKNNLAKNLKRMAKFFPLEYKFFPSTWLLPTEAHELREYLAK